MSNHNCIFNGFRMLLNVVSYIISRKLFVVLLFDKGTFCGLSLTIQFMNAFQLPVELKPVLKT